MTRLLNSEDTAMTAYNENCSKKNQKKKTMKRRMRECENAGESETNEALNKSTDERVLPIETGRQYNKKHLYQKALARILHK